MEVESEPHLTTYPTNNNAASSTLADHVPSTLSNLAAGDAITGAPIYTVQGLSWLCWQLIV